MAHNKLRRDIQQHLDSVDGAMWTGTPLLRRAFEALGGPVPDNRLTQETVNSPVDGLTQAAVQNSPATDDGGFLVNGINPDALYSAVDHPGDPSEGVSGMGEHTAVMDAVEPLVSGGGFTEDTHEY